MGTSDQLADRTLAPPLAAAHEAFGLMLAAVRNDGVWTLHVFDASQADRVRGLCVAEGFEVRPPADNDLQGSECTVAIRARKG